MSRQILWPSAILLVLVATWSACRQDQDHTAERIIGRWELREATRDGKPTESLEALYFEFLPDGKMNTNMAGVPETAAYTVAKNTIQQRQSRIEADYTIEDLGDSTMVLSAIIRDYNFRFRLGKANTN